MDRKGYGPILALTVLAGFSGGVLSTRILSALPDVHAQGTPGERLKTTPVQPLAPALPPAVKQVAPKEGVITVPTLGLAFKAPDGRVLARLSADQYGWGTFTIYNSVGTALASLSGSGHGGLLSINNNAGAGVVELRASTASGYDAGSGHLLCLRCSEKIFGWDNQ